jgi:uncharacterized protein YcfJ
MKKTILSITVASALIVLASQAFAQAPLPPANSFGDQARVLSARPVHDRIPIAREECWNDQVRTYEDRSVTRSDTGAAIGPGTVLGAVVGGVIGHQFGNSSGGRDRGTAAGAVIGGLVGNQVDRQNQGSSTETEVERVPVTRDVQRCRTVNEVRDATVGYDVRYEYRGREFVTRLASDPGRFVHVRVDVVAVETAPQQVPTGPRPPAYH